MNAFRTGNWLKKVTVAIMLLSLLAHVQTVFACQMMEHSGPIEHCCCDDMPEHNTVTNDQIGETGCCKITGQITVKTVDADSKESAALPSQPSFKPPPALLAFILVNLWPEIDNQSSPLIAWDFDTDPSNPGTTTYLSTLRLRI